MKLPYGAPNTFPARGGDTPDTPQYMARRLIVEQIKTAYFISHSIPTEGSAVGSVDSRLMVSDWAFALTSRNCDVWYDREIVPLIWINEQISQGGNKWTVIVEAGEYVFIDNTIET